MPVPVSLLSPSVIHVIVETLSASDVNKSVKIETLETFQAFSETEAFKVISEN